MMVSDQSKRPKQAWSRVLILVLVDDGLWHSLIEAEDKYFEVLILVLVDDGLWQQPLQFAHNVTFTMFHSSFLVIFSRYSFSLRH